MTQIAGLGKCTLLWLVVAVVCLTHAQLPCQTTQCPSDTYCANDNGTAECVSCDSSCATCDGPGINSCLQCVNGTYKPQNSQSCQPCPLGAFGVDCTGQCHCLNNVECDKANGHCGDWKCERGYTNIPQCQDLCPIGTFGLDCKFECHCAVGDNCSHVNGDCESGQCHPEWTGAGCQRRLPKLAKSPELVRMSCNNITVRWNVFNETNDIGKGPVQQYRLYKRQNITDPDNLPPWTLVAEIDMPLNSPKPKQVTYSVVTGLIPDEAYTFRVDAIGYEFDKLLSRFSVGKSSSLYPNLCTVDTDSEKVFESISITAQNSTYILISWVVLPVYANFQYNVRVTRQKLGNGNCDNLAEPAAVYGPYNITDQPIGLKDLQTWSRYKIEVAAFAKAVNVREIFSKEVLTSPVAPATTVRNLRNTTLTSTRADFVWDPVPCSRQKGPNFMYKLTLRDDDGLDLPYTMNNTRKQFYDLQPYTNYSVQVDISNDVGAGPSGPRLELTTLQGVPSAVEITSLSASYTTVNVTFQPPEKDNGILTTYTIRYSESPTFDTAESLIFGATDGEESAAVERLKADTEYFFKMAASTSVGIGTFGQVSQITTDQAPPPPQEIILRLASKTTTCITLEWEPPTLGANEIVTYVLEIQEADADETNPPTGHVLDGQERSLTQCNLKPSTLYIVTIRGLKSDQTPASTTIETFSTEHGTPPKPVAPVFVRSGYTNITIAIEPVVSLDVPVTSYQIQVQETVETGKRKKRWADIPGSVYAEIDAGLIVKKTEFLIGDGLEYQGYKNTPLKRNTLYMIYYVAVSTLNNDTTASWSQLKSAVRTVPFDSDLSLPIPLRVASKTASCLNVTWETATAIEDFITGFTFTIKKAGETPAPTITKKLLATATNYQECNLSPYTIYSVGISAQADNGVLATTTENFLTVHETPRKPVAPKFVNSSYTTITVAIEPVVLTDAPLTAYQIQVEQVSGNGRRKRVAGVPGYVVAQFSKDDIKQKMNFVIGDGNTQGGYNNAPLFSEVLYDVHYVVISTSSNITKYSYSSLSPPVKTVPYVEPEPDPIHDDDGRDVLIGVIVACVLLLLILIALLILYLWWRRRNRFSPYEVYEDNPTKVEMPPLKEKHDPETYWSTAYNLKDSRYIIAGRDLVYQEGQPYKRNREENINPDQPKIFFRDEFHNLPHKLKRATDTHACQNRHLNRFPHLLPYDHSLVQLRPDLNSRTTYVNASVIPGYKKPAAYIAAQSPFDEETVLDFWRLIYQKSIKTVVMITNVVEDNIVKCTQYWPNETKSSYGNFLLHLIETEEFADYTVRTIGVKVKGEEYPKTVKLFEFTAWPEHGVPDDPIPLLEMRYKVRRYHHDDPGPILVHCGTGMGRTGVFIAVDALIDQYAAEEQVRIFDYVSKIRKKRPYMVRTAKQYVFIYEAVFEEFHAGNTLVDYDLKERYHNWMRKNPLTGVSYLKDQFRLLQNFTKGPRKADCMAGLLEINIQKNRYTDVLPAEQHRPLLESLGGPNPTDYINAVFADGYLKKNQFIITQTPLHNTIMDFWKLVYDYDVRTIVMVENFKNEDDTCAEYWPNVNLKQFEPFFIETTAAYQQDNFTIRNFKISSTQHPKAPPRYVRQFQFNAWAQPSVVPQSKAMLLDLIDSVFTWQEEACQNDRPVIIHCTDGATHSGLFAILSVLCERMEEDEEVDVYRTIKHFKKRRVQILADYDQFRFCYKTIWDFMSMRMTGGTFSETQMSPETKKGVKLLTMGSHFDTLNDDAYTEI